MHYILASASPRRRELLNQIQMEFEVIPSTIEETITKTSPSDVVMELSAQKALDVYRNLPDTRQKDTVVIGADTVVAYRDEILGKPGDETEALDMLSMLADRTHQVYTGVTLVSQNADGTKRVHSFYESTDVTFYPVTREELERYVSSGDPMDKAGAYGIQGAFAVHVKEIRGDYNNVVGLPVARLYQELKQQETPAVRRRITFE